MFNVGCGLLLKISNEMQQMEYVCVYHDKLFDLPVCPTYHSWIRFCPIIPSSFKQAISNYCTSFITSLLNTSVQRVPRILLDILCLFLFHYDQEHLNKIWLLIFSPIFLSYKDYIGASWIARIFIIRFYHITNRHTHSHFPPDGLFQPELLAIFGVLSNLHSSMKNSQPVALYKFYV